MKKVASQSVKTDEPKPQRFGTGGYRGFYSREDLLAEISDRLKVMRTQESAHYVVPDYLAEDWQQKLRDLDDSETEAEQAVSAAAAASAVAVPSSVAGGNGGGNANGDSASSSSQINELWREKICEWCYQLVDHFDFNRECVAVAMSYLDRYLATRSVNRRIFQLAAMTAIHLAIKLFEPGKLTMSSLIGLSRGYFLAEHIKTMEDSMLQCLCDALCNALLEW